MVFLEFSCGPGRDPGPLVASLERYGAATSLVPATEATGAADAAGDLRLRVHLPRDEYREKRCRDLVAAWCRAALQPAEGTAGEPSQ